MDHEEIRNTPIHQLIALVDDLDVDQISKKARLMIEKQIPEPPEEGRLLGPVPEVVRKMLYLGAEVYLADMGLMNEIIGCESDCTPEELSGYVGLMDEGQTIRLQRFSVVVRSRQLAFKSVITSTLRSSFFEHLRFVEDIMIAKGFLAYAIPGLAQSSIPFIIEDLED